MDFCVSKMYIVSIPFIYILRVSRSFNFKGTTTIEWHVFKPVLPSLPIFPFNIFSSCSLIFWNSKILFGFSHNSSISFSVSVLIALAITFLFDFSFSCNLLGGRPAQFCKTLSRRWSSRRHILKSLSSKPTSPRKFPVLGSRTALFLIR